MKLKKLYFASDYQEGAHENILKRLMKTNMEHTSGYGTDGYCDSARNRIRHACGCENAEVEFLIGGTQANATVIDAFLHTYEGVIAAESGHVSIHEAGAIEFGGHKVLVVPSKLGKINADEINQYLYDFYHDANRTHMVQPGMVYISQPTEFGTLYSKKELSDLSKVCRAYNIPLYVDGARLAYALAASENDMRLVDLANFCDVFYIGGTKCGALFGEAVVIPDPRRIPHFFTIIKQHGALLAKGRILGIQFDELFKDDLYFRIGKNAVELAHQIKNALVENGYPLYFDSPTNQIFFVLENEKLNPLKEKVEYSFWEKYDKRHTVIRFATSWATSLEDVNQLIQVIASL